MTVIVNCLSGDKLELDVEPRDTVRALRRQVASVWNCSPLNVRLLAGDMEPRIDSLICDVAGELTAFSVNGRDFIGAGFGPEPVKLVLVGDGAVGKTSFLYCACNGAFPVEYDPTVEYIPTVVDNHTMVHTKGESSVALQLCDTGGDPAYERVRVLAYPNTAVFLVCFSLERRASFDHVASKWHVELQEHHRAAYNVVLVGLRSDLCSEGKRACSLQEAWELAELIGASDYVECSARLREGLSDVLDAAVCAIK